MSNIIVMAFSPQNIVGCLLKKRPTKGGGGHGYPRTPPRYALADYSLNCTPLSPITITNLADSFKSSS